jgi:hypothetical protein
LECRRPHRSGNQSWAMMPSAGACAPQ